MSSAGNSTDRGDRHWSCHPLQTIMAGTRMQTCQQNCWPTIVPSCHPPIHTVNPHHRFTGPPTLHEFSSMQQSGSTCMHGHARISPTYTPAPFLPKSSAVAPPSPLEGSSSSCSSRSRYLWLLLALCSLLLPMDTACCFEDMTISVAFPAHINDQVAQCGSWGYAENSRLVLIL
jgi:hypothetical protein